MVQQQSDLARGKQMTTNYRWVPNQQRALNAAKEKMPLDGVSPEEIERAKTPKGAWTKATLAQWGVPWPPPHGWKAELEARYLRAHPDELRRVVEVTINEVEQTTKNITLLSQEDLNALEFNRALRELQSIRHRYKNIGELSELFATVDQALANFAEAKTDATERRLDQVDWRSV